MDDLRVPTFARIDEYAGLWLMEQLAFRSYWDTASRIDLAAHAKEVQPVKSRMEMMSTANGQTVALVPVLGALMKQQASFGGTSTIQLRRDIRNAVADPNVSAIVMAFDSPGGTTAGLDDLASDIRNARRSKPVWAHVDDMCASAAYWLASQCEKIFANSATALVGSIGTYLTIYDQSTAAEQQGIKTLVFKTGSLKAAGVPGAPVTEEQQRYFQGIVDDVQGHFDAAVRKGRGMSAEQLAAVRTGGVFSATQAVDLKLIDGIQPLGKTISMVGREMKAKGAAARLPLALGGLPTLGN